MGDSPSPPPRLRVWGGAEVSGKWGGGRQGSVGLGGGTGGGGGKASNGGWDWGGGRWGHPGLGRARGGGGHSLEHLLRVWGCLVGGESTVLVLSCGPPHTYGGSFCGSARGRKRNRALGHPVLLGGPFPSIGL